METKTVKIFDTLSGMFEKYIDNYKSSDNVIEKLRRDLPPDMFEYLDENPSAFVKFTDMLSMIKFLLTDVKVKTNEELANYTDDTTYNNYNNEKFLESCIPPDFATKFKENFNLNYLKNVLDTMVIGAIACVAVRSPEPYSSRAKEALTFLRSLDLNFLSNM